MQRFQELIKNLGRTKALVVVGVLGICLMLMSGLWTNLKTFSDPKAEKSDTAQTNTGTSSSTGNNPNNSQEEPSISLSEEEVLEQRVQEVLEQIVGIGSVKVSISLNSGSRREYATNLKDNQRDIQEKDEQGGTRSTTENTRDEQLVLVSSSGQNTGEPVIIQEVKPEIKGVLVVAEGAEDARVREELVQTVQIILDIPAHKTRVLPKTPTTP